MIYLYPIALLSTSNINHNGVYLFDFFLCLLYRFEEVWGNGIISHDLWLSRRSDMNLCDIYFCGNCNKKFIKTSHINPEDKVLIKFLEQ
jgi:hypothetical protein